MNRRAAVPKGSLPRRRPDVERLNDDDYDLTPPPLDGGATSEEVAGQDRARQYMTYRFVEVRRIVEALEDVPVVPSPACAICCVPAPPEEHISGFGVSERAQA